jgi:hypothetical protein
VQRKKLAIAILKGCVFGWLIAQHFPGKGVVYLDLETNRVSASDFSVGTDYRAKAERVGKDRVMITVEPDEGFLKYLFFGMFVLLFASLFYRTDSEEDGSGNRAKPIDFGPEERFKGDPRFEEFVAEDESRQLVPRSVLEKDFADWKNEKARIESRERDSSV